MDDYDLTLFINTLRPFQELEELVLRLTIVSISEERPNQDVSGIMASAMSKLTKLKSLHFEFQ